MTIELTDEERESMLERVAEKIAAERLYNAEEAKQLFGLTRASLKHVRPTYLDGLKCPKYSLAEIRKYRKKKTHLV